MKTAIVTGAAGNLGKAIASKLLLEGFRVVGTIMPTETSPIEHPHFEIVRINLLNEQEATEFVNTYEIIDVAVLTVGGFAIGTITDTSAAAVRKQIDLNFFTAYHLAQPVFAKMMQRGKGRLFFIGSRPGLSPIYAAGMTAYSLGKSLLFRLAELMNEEAKGCDVVTTVMVPGTIDTPQNRAAMPDQDPSNWVSAANIADVVSYHCSPAAAPIREGVVKIYGRG